MQRDCERGKSSRTAGSRAPTNQARCTAVHPHSAGNPRSHDDLQGALRSRTSVPMPTRLAALLQPHRPLCPRLTPPPPASASPSGPLPRICRASSRAPRGLYCDVTPSGSLLTSRLNPRRSSWSWSRPGPHTIPVPVLPRSPSRPGPRPVPVPVPAPCLPPPLYSPFHICHQPSARNRLPHEKAEPDL